MNHTIIMSKYQGLGNDYLILDPKKNKVELQGKKVALLCQRGFGLGADGVLYGPVEMEGKLGVRIYNADGSEELIAAAAIANRTIGSVNAPSLIQKVIARCVDAEVDVAAYDRNRLALYNGLKELGFECIKPQGAFYLFVKSPVADEKAFCEAGKKYNILMVPGSSFACPGYVRLAYCVSYETIVNSLPQFAKLAKEFGLE